MNTDRLVPSPVFVLSTPRSGSTLLRTILGGHPEIHATTELILTEVGVEFRKFPARYGMHTVYTELAFANAGWTPDELDFLLWDRILHRELDRSGKSVLLHKAPRILLRWQRIAQCWPDARYIFLLRHPLHILESARRATGGAEMPWGQLTDMFLRFLHELVEARDALAGVTVRYEELTAEPEKTCAGVCAYLGLDWKPDLVAYQSAAPRIGTGDTGAKYRSGRVQPGRPLPTLEEIPQLFRPLAIRLGYG